jgi:hypothetical protein
MVRVMSNIYSLTLGGFSPPCVKGGVRCSVLPLNLIRRTEPFLLKTFEALANNFEKIKL